MNEPIAPVQKTETEQAQDSFVASIDKVLREMIPAAAYSDVAFILGAIAGSQDPAARARALADQLMTENLK